MSVRDASEKQVLCNQSIRPLIIFLVLLLSRNYTSGALEQTKYGFVICFLVVHMFFRFVYLIGCAGDSVMLKSLEILNFLKAIAK